MHTSLPPRRLGKQPLDNSQFANPTPYLLRTLVLDYLCHSCYASTARVFARDSTVRQVDADGDEIMLPVKGIPGDDAYILTEDVLRQVELRERVRTSILSGRVDEASNILKEHFPSVLDQSPPFTPKFEQYSPDRVEYVGPTSVDPAHLSLNLRIHAFIEAARTVPLEYTPPSAHDYVAVTAQLTPHNDDPVVADEHQSELLSRAQKLYAAANMLQKPSDRAVYLTELGNVGGLLAYKIPEESPMSKYLAQARREIVADQINSAILYRTGMPAISYLELYTRYTSTIWSFMHILGVKAPILANRPSGLESPITIRSTISNAPPNKFDKADAEVLPFDLQQFLDSKT